MFRNLVCSALLIVSCGAYAGANTALVDDAACLDPALDLWHALRLEHDCSRNARFLHQLGHLLNESHRYADAAERLESAILLEPALWGAHIDFAVALDGLGDRASAENLWRDLAREPAAQPLLDRALQRFASAQKGAPKRARTVMGLATGYDDNLLGATRYTSFNLTLPAAELPVEIDEAEQQRGGRFARLDLAYEADFATDPSARWRYSLVASHAESVDYSPASLSHLGARIERAPEGQRGWYGLGLVQYQHRGTRSSTYQTQLGAGLEWGGALLGLGARGRFGVEALANHYTNNGFADGRYLGLLSHWVCPGLQLQIQLRAGVDLPVQAGRTGGAQRQFGLRASHVFKLGAGLLTTEVDFFHQKDRQGYSPLLQNNAPRALSRMIYRAEYRMDYKDYSPFFGLERMNQRSNLPLFAPRNWVISTGFRRAW